MAEIVKPLNTIISLNQKEINAITIALGNTSINKYKEENSEHYSFDNIEMIALEGEKLFNFFIQISDENKFKTS